MLTSEDRIGRQISSLPTHVETEPAHNLDGGFWIWRLDKHGPFPADSLWKMQMEFLNTYIDLGSHFRLSPLAWNHI